MGEVVSNNDRHCVCLVSVKCSMSSSSGSEVSLVMG
jgi:hypothetical protein